MLLPYEINDFHFEYAKLTTADCSDAKKWKEVFTGAIVDDQ